MDIRYLKWAFLLSIVTALSLTIGITLTHAQESGSVQELTGRAEVGGSVFYTIPGLKQGQTLYVYVAGTSGNLDPAAALADVRLESETLNEAFWGKVERVMAQGRDPLEALPEIYDELFVIWDDDSGVGYDAAFEFAVPNDGDYQLLVARNPATDSFGDFRLLIGLDAPGVLSGDAQPTGAEIAFLDEEASAVRVYVQEITGTLTVEEPEALLTLRDLKVGDAFYAFVEATSGDLTPILVLRDYSGKPLRSGNLSGKEATASLAYRFEEDSDNDTLRILSFAGDGKTTTGDYRLLVGLNDPEVLTGEAVSTGEPVIREPIKVRVGIKIDQIPSVDQRAKNFTVVVNLQMRWTDSQLAFSPDTCQCDFKLFTVDEFAAFLIENGIRWPAYTVFNQQGELFPQNQLVMVLPRGEVIYFTRSTVTLQAPDFDFRKYPFDTQQFFIHIDLLFPEEFYIYTNLEGYSGLGDQLGLGEWIITEFDTSVGSQEFGSRFSLRFEAQRQINYYILRLFIPIVIIILVSWVTFFLKDYSNRVEVTAANLLLFIAFNFTIAADLPRLGYLTFMDMILISTFIVSALTVVFNVFLKRLEIGGNKELAERIDSYSLWLYPLVYALGAVLAIWIFLL